MAPHVVVTSPASPMQTHVCTVAARQVSCLTPAVMTLTMSPYDIPSTLGLPCFIVSNQLTDCLFVSDLFHLYSMETQTAQ